MSRGGNSSASRKLKITLSVQSLDLLEQLARRGIYGRSEADVAARFVDEKLQLLVPPASQPPLQVSLRRAAAGSKQKP